MEVKMRDCANWYWACNMEESHLSPSLCVLIGICAQGQVLKHALRSIRFGAFVDREMVE